MTVGRGLTPRHLGGRRHPHFYPWSGVRPEGLDRQPAPLAPVSLSRADDFVGEGRNIPQCLGDSRAARPRYLHGQHVDLSRVALADRRGGRGQQVRQPRAFRQCPGCGQVSRIEQDPSDVDGGVGLGGPETMFRVVRMTSRLPPPAIEARRVQRQSPDRRCLVIRRRALGIPRDQEWRSPGQPEQCRPLEAGLDGMGQVCASAPAGRRNHPVRAVRQVASSAPCRPPTAPGDDDASARRGVPP